jgi:hypothetical protein
VCSPLGRLLQRLPCAKYRKGSKARCHLLTHGTRHNVAARLTQLIAPYGYVQPSHQWMPDGFNHTDEAQLDKAPLLLPDARIRAQLAYWWLGSNTVKGTTPNWDIASTCTIEGHPGLLLIEAKAHHAELKDARCAAAPGSESAQQIAHALQEASNALTRAGSGQVWRLSPYDPVGMAGYDYQMANRFAWAWKLTTLDIPVILVYLGFLGADEMAGLGTSPITSADDWDRAIRRHGQSMVPEDIWERDTSTHGRLLIALIRALDLPLAPVGVRQ